jgi:hypothetical protein
MRGNGDSLLTRQQESTVCERLGSSAGLLAAFGAALLFAAFAILSLGPSPASAAKPCWELVLDDWADNARIDRPFSVACLQQALDRAPEDIRAYSDIEDQIRQALRDTVVRRPQSSTGNPEGPIEQALSVDTNDARSIPLPLLVLAASASALIIAGGAGMAVRKLRR